MAEAPANPTEQTSPTEQVNPMDQVRPKLWLGSREAALNTKTLKLRVSHVLSVGSEFPQKSGIPALEDERLMGARVVPGRSAPGRIYLKEGDAKADPFTRLVVKVDDVKSADLAQHLDECRVFIKEGLAQRGVLVHCWEGKNRSAAVVAAYLMQKEKKSIAHAFLALKEKRPCVDASKFVDQLSAFEVKWGIEPASPKTAEKAGALKRAERPNVYPQVYLELAVHGDKVGRVVMELFTDAVPKTAENFRCLCTGEKGRGKDGKRLNYLGCIFHRVVPGLGIIGGDFTNKNGTGGESIYGYDFEDENFTIKHSEPGIVSMANSGPNTNGSQFLICTKPAPHLDGKNVAFAKVVSGIEIVEQIEQLGLVDGEPTEDGAPTRRVTIMDCGEVEQRGVTVKRAKVAKPDTLRVLHILHKHKGVKKPTSWDGQQITCSKEEAEESLERLRKQLVGPPEELQSRFAALATKHSHCKSAKKGGDLGPFEKGMTPKPFEEALLALKPGELSAVVSDKHGEHLILRLQ